MLLKSFFFNIYVLLFNFSFYLFIFLSFISINLLFTSLRKKFLFYILVIISFSIWGFLLDLDGMMLVFLTAEFTIVLLFLMTYIQLYSNYTFIKSETNFKVFLLLVFLLLQYYVPLNSPYTFTCYYKSLNHIVSSDFFILYYFLFEKLPILVILVTLIISFFSLFFILIYYSLKLTKLDSFSTVKNLYFLRKQNLIKQTSFKTNLYTFQN